MCGPSIIDTNHALALQADALQGIYTLKADAMDTALGYDCADTAKAGMCGTVGARYTGVGGTSTDAFSGTAGLAYNVAPHLRIGGYFEQQFSSSDDRGVDSSSRAPLLALFGAWQQNPDGMGFNAHVSAGYDHDSVRLTRPVVLSSEAGVGTAGLNTSGTSAVLSYGMHLQNGWAVVPYGGLRYTRITREGYTESGVPNPLTFSSMSDSDATVLAGVEMVRPLTERFMLDASLGFEADVAHPAGTNKATGIGPGTLGASLNGDDRTFRPSATVNGVYAVRPGGSFIAGVTYSEAEFSGTNAVDVTAGYQFGF